MLNGLLWVNLFFFFMLVMILAVPRSNIIRLLPIGLFGGFGQSVILLSLVVPVLGWWRFNYTDIFSVAGIPLFASLAWTPVVIIYTYYLGLTRNLMGLYSYIATFSLGTGLFVHWLYRAGFLEFVRWNSLFTVLVAVMLYAPVTYFIFKTNRELGHLFLEAEK